MVGAVNPLVYSPRIRIAWIRESLTLVLELKIDTSNGCSWTGNGPNFSGKMSQSRIRSSTVLDSLKTTFGILEHTFRHERSKKLSRDESYFSRQSHKSWHDTCTAPSNAGGSVSADLQWIHSIAGLPCTLVMEYLEWSGIAHAIVILIIKSNFRKNSASLHLLRSGREYD